MRTGQRPQRLRRLGICGLTAALAAAVAIGPTATAQAAPGSDRTPSGQARRVGITRSGGGYAGWAMRAEQLKKPGASSDQLTPQPQATAGTVEGIDVSSYQGNVDWAGWWSKGKRFAYVKATEGTSYRNPYFSQQYNGAYQVGMIRGAYAFARPDGASGAAQAKYFLAHGGGWTADGKTLPGALDIEDNYTGGDRCWGNTPAQNLAWLKSFTGEYWSVTHRHMPIYTNASFWKDCVGNATHYGSTNPLWIAYWDTPLPRSLPGGWPYETFWQYSGAGTDLDRFSSTAAQLKKLAVTTNS